MDKERPRCVGCGKTDEECGEYDIDDPVENDGTYKDNKFVCTNCYVKLIPLGMDVGSPTMLQIKIDILKKSGRW